MSDFNKHIMHQVQQQFKQSTYTIIINKRGYFTVDHYCIFAHILRGLPVYHFCMKTDTLGVYMRVQGVQIFCYSKREFMTIMVVKPVNWMECRTATTFNYRYCSKPGAWALGTTCVASRSSSMQPHLSWCVAPTCRSIGVARLSVPSLLSCPY